MSATLQLEEVPVQAPVHEVPQLLVPWSSRWREFMESIRPAFGRSERRLAGEAPFGLVPLRIILPSYAIEAFVIFAALAIQVKVAELRPIVVPTIRNRDVVYYSGDELPRTEDLGGAQAGAVGRAGGQQAHHRTQTIKIARGGSLASQIVDAPDLKLQSSRDPVANLLAIRPNIGPPPVEGLHSARRAPTLPASVVAATPDVIHDYTRNVIHLDSALAPPPSVTRDRALTAPNLTATMIAPPPSVADDHRLVAPLMVPAVVPAAPSVPRDHRAAAPRLDPSVVAAAPTVANDHVRSSPSLSANVIPAAPSVLGHDVTSAPVRMADAAVVAPPVSAPERASGRASKLTLPAPAIVAPPPSTNVSGDMRRLANGGMSATTVVPPPAQPASGSFMSSLIGKIFGPTEVVAPPPSVNSAASGNSAAHSLAGNVLPPPVDVKGSGDANETRRSGASLSPTVVAPPASLSISGATRSVASLTPNVVAPPASVASSAATRSMATLGAPNVVAPPPSIAAGRSRVSTSTQLTNVLPAAPSIAGGETTGSGRKGLGLGAPLESGSTTAPANSGGSNPNAGIVASNQPGPKLGIPANGAPGSLAMAPPGGDKSGIGGSGGGNGIGNGNSSGSGLSSMGSGAGKAGIGHGSDVNARGGISSASGSGGAGNANSGVPPVRGVDISGGSVMVSFDDPSTTDPSGAPRTSLKGPQRTFEAEVVGTASSGGAFEPYKNLLRGETHTQYLDTSNGTVVMEYAEPSGDGTGTLDSPRGLRTNLPEGLPHARMVVACTLDNSGNLTSLRVLEPGPAVMTAKVVAALRAWKFQPAMRGNQPVAVTAILGFGIDTNDRF